jgi:hypothetical protein
MVAKGNMGTVSQNPERKNIFVVKKIHGSKAEILLQIYPQNESYKFMMGHN